MLSWADSKYGVPALCVLAFTESSFFPIPRNVLLIALALAAPTRAYRFAAWCTVFSVLGGLFGYFIGYALWAVLRAVPDQPRVLAGELRARHQQVQRIRRARRVRRRLHADPLQGIHGRRRGRQAQPAGFTVASIFGRGGRFFLVALVIRLAGPRARKWIDEYFNLATVVGTLLLIGGFLLIKFMH